MLPNEIELTAKDDHTLLVMVVMQGNETVRHLEKINHALEGHSRRITNLEIKRASNNPNFVTRKQKATYSGIGASIAIIIYIVYELIRLFS